MKNLKNNFYKIIYFFQKASGYWTSGKRHEVIGTVQNAKGLYNIFFFVYVILFWITHPWKRYPKENNITSLYFCIFCMPISFST